MRFKVYKGTASNGDDTLCSTCSHSGIIRGRTLDEEIVHCRAIGMRPVRVTFKVTSCSDYSDAREPTYMQLLEQAWILQPGSKKRPAGFIRASELRVKELNAVIADLHDPSDE